MPVTAYGTHEKDRPLTNDEYRDTLLPIVQGHVNQVLEWASLCPPDTELRKRLELMHRRARVIEQIMKNKHAAGLLSWHQGVDILRGTEAAVIRLTGHFGFGGSLHKVGIRWANGERA